MVFFGASLLFTVIRNATKEQGTGVSLALQGLAGLLLVGAIVLVLRRRG